MSIEQAPHLHPHAKLHKMSTFPARLSQVPGIPMPGGLLSSAQSHKKDTGTKQCMRNEWQQSWGKGPSVSSGTEPSVPAPQPCREGPSLSRVAAEAAQLWNKYHWKPDQLLGARVQPLK